MTSQKEYIGKIINHVNHLPPMPANIIKLRKASQDPNTNFAMLSPLIEEDPGLCADILHIANSAFYGVNHRVDTIQEAIRYFGMKHLIDFISLSFSDKVIKKSYSSIKNLDKYFIHSKQIAIASRILAKHAGRNKKYQDFFHVCGLLHDIGRLIVLVVSEDSTKNLIGDSWKDVANIIEKEKECLGVDHCFIGMQICNKWQFSERLQQTILRHHSPVKDDICEEAAFILLAHFISMKDIPEEMVLKVYSAEIMKKIGLTEKAILMAKEDYFSNPDIKD